MTSFKTYLLSFIVAILFALPCSAQVAATNITQMVSVNATTTSTKVLNADVGRNYLIIQNNGSASVIVKFGSVQSGSEGIVIIAGGNYEPVKAITNSVYVKSASGSQALTILVGKEN